MSMPKFYKNAYLYLALGLVIVVIGFTPSYFSRLSELSSPYHIHGISATLWMILLIIQPYLYKKGKLKLHKILGWSSLVLVPMIIIGGMKMMQFMIQHQENYPPDTVYKLAFIDALTLFSFGLLFLLAIWYRRNLQLHARYMVSTIFGPLLPALTRVFFILGIGTSFDTALTYSYLLVELVLILIIWTERTKKEMKITYFPFLAFIVLEHLLMYFSNEWIWWRSIMNAFAS